jgi:hypothetical protein
MSVEDETLKVLFAFFGLARRSSLEPLPSPLTLWLFFIDNPAPKARNTQSKLHATQKLTRSHYDCVGHSPILVR